MEASGDPPMLQRVSEYKGSPKLLRSTFGLYLRFISCLNLCIFVMAVAVAKPSMESSAAQVGGLQHHHPDWRRSFGCPHLHDQDLPILSVARLHCCENIEGRLKIRIWCMGSRLSDPLSSVHVDYCPFLIHHYWYWFLMITFMLIIIHSNAYPDIENLVLILLLAGPVCLGIIT